MQVRATPEQPAVDVEPSFRAAYSSNPGFTLGADRQPPCQPEDMLLARPAIQEALDRGDKYLRHGLYYLHRYAIERDGGVVDTERFPELETVRPTLALKGLRWLDKQLRSEKMSPLKADIRQAKENVHAQISPPQPAPSEALPIESQVIAPPRRAPKKTISSHGFDPGTKARIALGVQSEQDQTDGLTKQILAVFAKLAYHPDPKDSDRLVFDDVKAYQKEIGQLSDAIHQNPQLFHDFALTLCRIISTEDPQSSDLEQCYKKVYRDVRVSIINTPIKITESVVSKWLAPATQLPHGSLTDDYVLDLSSVQPSSPVSVEKLVAIQAAQLGRDILVEALSRICRPESEPADILDAIYMVADIGMQPLAENQFKLTLGLIDRVMRKNDFALLAVKLIPSSNQSPEHRVKAFDLSAVLSRFEVITPLPAMIEPRLNAWQLRLLLNKQHLPSGLALKGGDIDELDDYFDRLQAANIQDTYHRFMTQRDTPGTPSTLFSRSGDKGKVLPPEQRDRLSIPYEIS